MTRFPLTDLIVVGIVAGCVVAFVYCLMRIVTG